MILQRQAVRLLQAREHGATTLGTAVAVAEREHLPRVGAGCVHGAVVSDDQHARVAEIASEDLEREPGWQLELLDSLVGRVATYRPERVTHDLRGAGAECRQTGAPHDREDDPPAISHHVLGVQRVCPRPVTAQCKRCDGTEGSGTEAARSAICQPIMGG
jgi:hypothetical protein